jgi:septal ring factor EnvC (AmiA/AmiB activator)
MAEIDLTFISKQLERVLAEQAGMRDELLVLAARFARLEAAVNVVTVEVRALGNQVGRMNDRIAKLEAVE